jgi:hypothetical protein
MVEGMSQLLPKVSSVQQMTSFEAFWKLLQKEVLGYQVESDEAAIIVRAEHQNSSMILNHFVSGGQNFGQIAKK